MRLPDFSRSVDFTRLRLSMGIEHIPELPAVQFVRTVTHRTETAYVAPEDVKLDADLKAGAAVEVDSSSLVVVDGFLTVRGRKVVAYIRDQRQSVDWGLQTSGYRYHLMDCSTMQSMRQAGRQRRYLASQRTDGRFEVRASRGWQRHEHRGEIKLELCQNCQYDLAARSFWFSPFSLTQFFAKFDSGVPQTLRRIEEVEETQTYQPNQADVAREYKRATNHCCQQCRVNCSSIPGLLQLHHVDGDTSNNEHANLLVLCTACHSAQPYHAHMGRSGIDRERIEKVKVLRRQQGIF